MKTVTLNNKKYQIDSLVNVPLHRENKPGIETCGVRYSAEVRMVNKNNAGGFFERYRVDFDWTSDAGVTEKNFVEFLNKEQLNRIERQYNLIGTE